MGHYRKFKFTVADIAARTGQPQERVRRHIRTGVFDPGDLASLIAYLREKEPPEAVDAVGLLRQALAEVEKMAANAEGESRAASARTLHPLVGNSEVSE